MLYIEQADEYGRDGGAHHESCGNIIVSERLGAVFATTQRTFCHERMFKRHAAQPRRSGKAE